MNIAVLESLEVLSRGLETMLRRLKRISSLECHRTTEELVLAIKDGGGEGPPDVIILSCCAHEAITDQVRTTFPASRILELIARDDPEHLELAARTCADGYLMMRDITEATLDVTLQALMRGELPMPLPVASYLLERARSSEMPPSRRQPYFSPREHDVVTLLLEGLSNRQIADRLRISLHSAKRQVSTVLNKVNSPSRAHFVAQMLRDE